MLNYFLRKLLMLIPTTLGVVGIVSLLIHLVPGDPVDIMLGDYATNEEKLQMKMQLGLNRSIGLQVLSYLRGILTLDLGESLSYNRPVYDLIAERLPSTFQLGICSILVALLISLPLGIISALNRDKFSDKLAMLVSLLGVAIPNFWLGPMLILIFSIHFGVLPVSEKSSLASFILPSLTLGTSLAAIISRMTRNSILEIAKENFVRTAIAKGNSPHIVMLKHILKNAALPIVTIVGLQFGVLLTGAIITETVFDWPGLGCLIVEALGQRDYPLVQGCVFTFSLTYIVVNFFTDMAYGWLDPRIKFGKN